MPWYANGFFISNEDKTKRIGNTLEHYLGKIYVQETSRIMDISEELLFNTLAQITKKEIQELGKKYKEDQKAFEVIKEEKVSVASKIDIKNLLEHKIIEILLLY